MSRFCRQLRVSLYEEPFARPSSSIARGKSVIGIICTWRRRSSGAAEYDHTREFDRRRILSDAASDDRPHESRDRWRLSRAATPDADTPIESQRRLLALGARNLNEPFERYAGTGRHIDAVVDCCDASQIWPRRAVGCFQASLRPGSGGPSCENQPVGASMTPAVTISAT